MKTPAFEKYYRVIGVDAVLDRLSKVGKNPRTLENLIKAGFPEIQLTLAKDEYATTAKSNVARYAVQKMSEGVFEDESLLEIFCRYYECTDWKLEQSPWFFSKGDYRKFFQAVLSPIEFQIALLKQFKGKDRWEKIFQKNPFTQGLEKAKLSLWDEVCRGEYYWKPMSGYPHQRAADLFTYLIRVIEPVQFSPNQFSYRWEKPFRKRLLQSMTRFEEALDQALRVWQETGKAKKKAHFRPGNYQWVDVSLEKLLQEALHFLELEANTVTEKSLAQAFRRISKQAHPDKGGSPEDFRKLSTHKTIVESWLKQGRPRSIS